MPEIYFWATKWLQAKISFKPNISIKYVIFKNPDLKYVTPENVKKKSYPSIIQW
jgi:hypothetical protein